MNACVIPVTRTSQDNRWISQHTRHIHECKEAEPEVLLIGDSIIQKMIYCDKFWSKVSSLHPLNLGIGGDSTQNVLWRIINGSLHQTHPRVVILHVGTNNYVYSPLEIAEGILKIIAELQALFPEIYIIVWGLLPRGQHPNVIRNSNKKVNEILSEKLEENSLVELICTGDILIQSDGTISEKDMYDYLHLTEQGYIKTFTPVLEKTQEIILNTGS